MKKIVYILIIIICIFCFCSCGRKDLSFEKFEDKYKRASYDDFIKNPSVFLKDLYASNTIKRPSEKDLSCLEGLEKDEGLSYDTEMLTYSSYSKDGVLFGKAVEYSFGYTKFKNNPKEDSLHYAVIFDTGNQDTDWEIAVTLANKMFDLYGDGETFEIENETVSESDIVKLLGSNKKQSFTITFKDVYLSFSYIEGYTDNYSFVFVS